MVRSLLREGSLSSISIPYQMSCNIIKQITSQRSKNGIQVIVWTVTSRRLLGHAILMNNKGAKIKCYMSTCSESTRGDRTFVSPGIIGYIFSQGNSISDLLLHDILLLISTA